MFFFIGWVNNKDFYILGCCSGDCWLIILKNVVLVEVDVIKFFGINGFGNDGGGIMGGKIYEMYLVFFL